MIFSILGILMLTLEKKIRDRNFGMEMVRLRIRNMFTKFLGIFQKKLEKTKMSKMLSVKNNFV